MEPLTIAILAALALAALVGTLLTLRRRRRAARPPEVTLRDIERGRNQEDEFDQVRWQPRACGDDPMVTD